MSANLPIACSLTAGELSRRLSTMAALGREALVQARTRHTRAELRFAAGAGVRERVDAVVAAEAECCAFLTMRISEEPDLIVLTIEAPEDAAFVLQELVAVFRGTTAQHAVAAP